MSLRQSDGAGAICFKSCGVMVAGLMRSQCVTARLVTGHKKARVMRAGWKGSGNNLLVLAAGLSRLCGRLRKGAGVGGCAGVRVRMAGALLRQFSE